MRPAPRDLPKILNSAGRKFMMEEHSVYGAEVAGKRQRAMVAAASEVALSA